MYSILDQCANYGTSANSKSFEIFQLTSHSHQHHHFTSNAPSNPLPCSDCFPSQWIYILRSRLVPRPLASEVPPGCYSVVSRVVSNVPLYGLYLTRRASDGGKIRFLYATVVGFSRNLRTSIASILSISRNVNQFL
jgi:hypothetical protein